MSWGYKQIEQHIWDNWSISINETAYELSSVMEGKSEVMTLSPKWHFILTGLRETNGPNALKIEVIT